MIVLQLRDVERGRRYLINVEEVPLIRAES